MPTRFATPLLAVTVSLSVLLTAARSAHADPGAKNSAPLTVSVQVSRSCLVGGFDARVSAMPQGSARREAMVRAVHGALSASCRLTDSARVDVIESRVERATQRLEIDF